MKSIDTLTHFAKFQYIEKYWTREVPDDYPIDADVEFDTQYDTIEEYEAVKEMESQLGTEESIVTEFIPEDNYVSDYLGTYNVFRIDEDSTGPVLLSPNRIPDNVGVIAMHYNDGTWENVEDVEVVDGYAYGTLDSLSPVSVFLTKKDIEVKEGYLWKGMIAVYANGNPIRVYTNEDNKGIIQNKVTGKEYEITSTETVLFGGSSDGTVIDECNISVEAGEYPSLDIKGGSQSPEVQTTNKLIKITAKDAKLGCISGAAGKVHVDELIINMKNVELAWFGAGESYTYLASGNKDANAGLTPDTVDLNAPYWCKKVTIKAENVKTTLAYASANTGMSYTKEVKMDIVGGEIAYMLFCGSNGRTGSVTGSVSGGCVGQIFQTNNRGIVESVNVSIDDSDIQNLFITGDATDSTVTGVTKAVSLDIGKGTYALKLGTQGGVELTQEEATDVVGKIKYSRSANMTFDENVKSVLGDKLVLK